MSNKDKKQQQQGELSEEQLDGVSGGQEVRKMETIVVTAKRLPPEPKVVKMETITVVAQRVGKDAGATAVHTASVARRRARALDRPPREHREKFRAAREARRSPAGRCARERANDPSRTAPC